MARGDTQPPRRHFDEAGPDEPVAATRYRSYGCLANDCPMPAGIFLNGSDAPGICAWHYGSDSNSMPRITGVMRSWQCLTDAINRARSFVANPNLATNVKAAAAQRDSEWKKLSQLAEGWSDLAPKPGQNYGDWGRELELFLTDRINHDVFGRTAVRTKSPVVLEMLSQLRRSTAGETA